jgi:hypothetical protein
VIREFHYYFSSKSHPAAVIEKDLYLNLYCSKTSISAIKKLRTFDSVFYSRGGQQIRYFKLSSTLESWYLAVFYARVL